MPYFLCGKQKQNTLGICWLWSVSVLFRFVFEEGPGKAVLLCQAQPRFHLELDSKAQANKGILKKEKISEFVIDETLIKVGPESVWLWVAMEPKNKEILALTVFKERNMLVAERFISGLVKSYVNDMLHLLVN